MPDTFKAWVADDKHAVDGKLTWKDIEVKKWTETDIEMDVICCGVCASDLHTLRSGWGESNYPTVVGHEIVGKVTKIGSEVKTIKVGDTVGIGAQCDSCGKCHLCGEGRQQYCMEGQVGTYQGKYTDGSGMAQGGYAEKWRGPARLAIHVPKNLDPSVAGPLMCGGATIYSPLADYGCGKPGGMNVGVVGIGGIGAFGLAFAKALGATKIVAISSTSSKKDLALELGATDFLALKEDPKGWKKYAKQLDIIVNTASNEDAPFDKFLGMTRPRGHVVNIAIAEKPLMPIPVFPMVMNGANIGGSAIAGRTQLEEMLQLVADKQDSMKLMIEKRSLKDANQVVLDMAAGKPRFRYVMMNDQ